MSESLPYRVFVFDTHYKMHVLYANSLEACDVVLHMQDANSVLLEACRHVLESSGDVIGKQDAKILRSAIKKAKGQ